MLKLYSSVHWKIETLKDQAIPNLFPTGHSHGNHQKIKKTDFKLLL